MTTATKPKSPSAELARLEEARKKAHAEARAIRRKVQSHEAETQSMQAELSARCHGYPEEVEGASLVPIEGTEAHRLRTEIKRRMGSPNPHEPDLAAAVTRFHAADELVTNYRRVRIDELIAEATEPMAELDERSHAVWQEIAEIAQGYGAVDGHVREIITTTPPLSDQHRGHDPRPSLWLQQAEAALETGLTPPHLTELGAHRLDKING
jgi:hypothetical protein